MVLVSLTTLTKAQEYPNLKMDDAKSTETDNTVFKPGTELTYQVIIHSSPKDTVDIHYTVLSLKNKDKTNKKQTEVGITYSYSKRLLEQTGIVENQDNLWMHPPRNGRFKALEIYPFPYIKHNMESWTDLLEIGGHWIDSIHDEKRIKLTLQYTREGVETTETPLGKLDCTVIRGTSVSELGQFIMKSYYHEKYGFVKLMYLEGTYPTFGIYLTQMKTGPPITEPYDLILKRR